jgi:hypothetical protein
MVACFSVITTFPFHPSKRFELASRHLGDDWMETFSSPFLEAS